MSEPQPTTTVLQAIRDRGPLSRSAVARATGIPLSTVSMATKALLARGLIEETGTSQAGMGRPSILLALRTDRACLAGGCIHRDALVGVLTDLGGRVLARRSEELGGFAPEDVVQAFAGVVERLLEDAGVPRARLEGAGFALSGLMDGRAGVCVRSTVFDWPRVPIGTMMEEALGVPVALENDANAIAVGERLFGDTGEDDFALLSVGYGIGAGIFVRGELYHGRHGASGELGHCTIEPGGPACRCGKRGCLEAIAGIPAVLARAHDAGLRVGGLDELEAIAESDERARAILERAGAALGLGLSYLVNLFSPDLVIVAGSGVRLGATLQGALRASLSEHLLPILPHPPRLSFQHEDEAVGARGAASLAAQAFLQRGGESPPGAAVPARERT